MFEAVKAHATLAFEVGKEIGEDIKKEGVRKAFKKHRGQLSMGAIGGIAGVILLLYVILLVISKFRPTIVTNIQSSNDTVSQEMLGEVDSNTKSSLSMSSLVPFVAAISLVLGLLFAIFRS